MTYFKNFSLFMLLCSFAIDTISAMNMQPESIANQPQQEYKQWQQEQKVKALKEKLQALIGLKEQKGPYRFQKKLVPIPEKIPIYPKQKKSIFLKEPFKANTFQAIGPDVPDTITKPDLFSSYKQQSVGQCLFYGKKRKSSPLTSISEISPVQLLNRHRDIAYRPREKELKVRKKKLIAPLNQQLNEPIHKKQKIN